MDSTQFLLALSVALFCLGLVGVVVRRNALVVLMCMELTVNAVVLSLVAFAARLGSAAGAAFVFLIFVVAAAEIAVAIAIVMLLARQRRTLDVGSYTGLGG